MHIVKPSLGLPAFTFFLVFFIATLPFTFAFSGSGSGTIADPYRITNCAQLQEMNAELGANYALVRDIPCSSTVDWNSGTGFQPIGSETTPFTGTLDGQEHTIRSLYINIQLYDCGDIAFFGKILGSSIKNLGLENISVITANCARVATLAAKAESSLINGVNANGYVSGRAGVGGLVASLIGGSINNSYVDVDVRGVKPVNDTRNVEVLGGIVGVMTGTIENVHVASDVVSTDPSSRVIGGMVGKSGRNLLANSFATGNVTGATLLGGIMGSSGNANITNTYYNNHANNPDICVGSGATTQLNCTLIENNRSYFRQSNNEPMASWDFTNDWSICTGERLPFLKWQNTSCDGDGVAFEDDNCPESSNSGQGDADGDGRGDACDPQTCRNNILEFPELCDDGDNTNNDACSNSCIPPDVSSEFDNTIVENNGNKTYNYEFIDDNNITLVEIPNNRGLIDLETTAFNVRNNPTFDEISITDLPLNGTTKSVSFVYRSLICAVDEADFVAGSASRCPTSTRRIIWSVAGGNGCGAPGTPVQGRDRNGNVQPQYTCERFIQGTVTYALMKGFNHTYIAAFDDNDLDDSPAEVDCDDNDPAIFPGAEEICGDGKDNDCSGMIDDMDTDGDNVTECNDEDRCLDTELPEPMNIKSNRYGDIDGDGTFETIVGNDNEEDDHDDPRCRLKETQYTLNETYGCSCTQILDCKPGNNTGEYRRGCLKATITKWISQTGWAAEC